jgi:hypothetical protein
MPKYGKAAAKSVKRAMVKRKHGTLRSGKAGHGGRVKSRSQAIARSANRQQLWRWIQPACCFRPKKCISV